MPLKRLPKYLKMAKKNVFTLFTILSMDIHYLQEVTKYAALIDAPFRGMGQAVWIRRFEVAF